MNYGKTKLLLIIFTAIIFTVIALFLIDSKYQAVSVKVPSLTRTLTPIANNTSTPDSNNSTSSIPRLQSPEVPTDGGRVNLKSVNLKVPFTPQAPTANWDELHNEACEEAGAIMASEYFASSTKITLDPKLVETEIEKLTKWQLETFGYYLDITSAETARMIEEVYGLHTKLISNFSSEDIKTALTNNQLILISTNGRLLKNPNYRRPGPIHHMLLVKGYNQKEFITNDSGTKNGLNYPYAFETLYNAAADWDQNAKNVNLDSKIAILVWKF